MPRANRHHISGQVWHITHRCHATAIKSGEHLLGVEVLGRNMTQDNDAYILREPDVAYNAHFDTEKEALSMDNGVYFDENEAESIG